MKHVASAVVLLCCFVCAMALTASAGERGAVPTSQIDAIFADLRSDSAPGAAVLVLRHGRAIFARGYGLSDMSAHAPITPQTDFRLASLSKEFTATAVMLLVRDGKLRLDEPLTEALPGFPDYGRAITIRNLLNHTSGLEDYEDIMAAQHGGTVPDDTPQIRDAGVVELLEQAKGTKFAPGTKWQYSNSGYATLAMVVERASDEKYENFVHERIFKPLGMRHTLAYVKGENQVPNRALGYTRGADGSWAETDQSPTSAVLGDGGIYTSLDDMARWLNGLAHHKLLTSAEIYQMSTAVNLPAAGPESEPASYGFGFFVNPYQGHRRLWHYGETVGFRTSVQYFPDDDLAIVVLSNRANENPGQRALKIADLFLGK